MKSFILTDTDIIKRFQSSRIKFHRYESNFRMTSKTLSDIVDSKFELSKHGYSIGLLRIFDNESNTEYYSIKLEQPNRSGPLCNDLFY